MSTAQLLLLKCGLYLQSRGCYKIQDAYQEVPPRGYKIRITNPLVKKAFKTLLTPRFQAVLKECNSCCNSAAWPGSGDVTDAYSHGVCDVLHEV